MTNCFVTGSQYLTKNYWFKFYGADGQSHSATQQVPSRCKDANEQYRRDEDDDDNDDDNDNDNDDDDDDDDDEDDDDAE